MQICASGLKTPSGEPREFVDLGIKISIQRVCVKNGDFSYLKSTVDCGFVILIKRYQKPTSCLSRRLLAFCSGPAIATTSLQRCDASRKAVFNTSLPVEVPVILGCFFSNPTYIGSFQLERISARRSMGGGLIK